MSISVQEARAEAHRHALDWTCAQRLYDSAAVSLGPNLAGFSLIDLLADNLESVGMDEIRLLAACVEVPS